MGALPEQSFEMLEPPVPLLLLLLLLPDLRFCCFHHNHFFHALLQTDACSGPLQLFMPHSCLYTGWVCSAQVEALLQVWLQLTPLPLFACLQQLVFEHGLLVAALGVFECSCSAVILILI